MNKTKTILLAAMIFISCNSGHDEKIIPPPSLKTYIAVWVDKDSTRKVGFLGRQITQAIKYDSVTKKSSIGVDTLCAYTITIPLLDSAKKPLLDSLGKPKNGIKYMMVNNSKDTIMWNIYGLDIDSLLKIKGKF